MENLTDCEAKLLHALRELEESTSVRIFFKDVQDGGATFGNPELVFREASNAFNFSLPDSMKQSVTRFSPFACHWRIERDNFKITGEFNLHHLIKALEKEPPSLDWDNTQEEQDLYWQFRVIDDFPGGGTDSYAALRIDPDLHTPQVWYHDMRRGAVQLDIDYSTYLHMVTITKGTIGWQYLFSQVDLGRSEFQNFTTRLEHMLGVFPDIFPEHDYLNLHERLEARL
ncbi:hypothetical protein GCM10009854_49570 [Saccharopolyspora halophila]|uniref:Knr4/Smi1-like domain-containing protein n=1 Tax=Saccharopolyspora halophila TaxID=405551 RepID=A0ABN3GZE4_9PSEU